MIERQLFVTSLYFVVTTSTSVGYGDYVASTFNERSCVFFIEFIGILVFANLQGIYPQIIFLPKLQTIVATKVADIKQYLQ